jgi:hypothetical protein
MYEKDKINKKSGSCNQSVKKKIKKHREIIKKENRAFSL